MEPALPFEVGRNTVSPSDCCPTESTEMHAGARVLLRVCDVLTDTEQPRADRGRNRAASGRRSQPGSRRSATASSRPERADGDLRTPAGARTLVEHAVAKLGGLDLVVHAAGDGFAPKPFEEVTEERLGRGHGRHREGDVLPRPGGGAGAAGVARRARDRGGRRRLPRRGLRSPPHSAAKAAQAMLTRSSPARSPPRCGSAALRPARSRSSRARRSAAQPRRWSAGSAVRRTWRTPSPTSRAPRSSRGRSLVVDGGTLLKSGGGQAP